MDPQFISKLDYISRSLIVQTNPYDYALDIERDGSYTLEYDYPVRIIRLQTSDQVNEFFKSKTIVRIMLLDHDTDEETFLYVRQ